MGSPQLGEHRLRGAGAAIGFAGALAALAFWSVPASSRVGDLELGVRLEASGALESSVSELIPVRKVRPGRPALATATVRNQSGATVGVRVRALGPRTEMDSRFVVHVVAGDRRLYEASLGRLRKGTRLRFALRRGQSRDVSVQVRLRAGLADGYAGRYETLTLRLQEEAFR